MPGPRGVRKMGRTVPKLTENFLKTFRPAPGSKDRMVFDTECRGLGVRATAGGNKMFLIQWSDAGTGRKQREPLGAWGSITLEQARVAARARLGRVAQGFNPIAERARIKAEDQRQRAATAAAKEDARFTLSDLIADWAKLHLAGKRPRYAVEAERALRVAFAAHLSRPASSLTHAAVTAVLDGKAGGGKAPIAGRTMAYGRACYGWAVKRRRLALNPFAGLPAIQGANPSRDRVLADGEVRAIWRAAAVLGLPFGPIMQLLLLTAQRRQEVAAMRWSELSADLTLWVLPGSRAKNGRAHLVHLAAPARAILASLPRIAGQDLVFSTTGATPPSGFSKAKLALDAAIAKLAAERAATLHSVEADPAWRLHDIRRTAVTWLAGAGFPPHAMDKLLNHTAGGITGVAAIYQRNEFLAERMAALDAWAAHVTGVEPAGNVVRLARAL
jgi:integrase